MAEVTVAFELPDYVLEASPAAGRNVEMMVLAALMHCASDEVFGKFRLWLTSSGAPADLSGAGAQIQPADLRTLAMSLKLDGQTVRQHAAGGDDDHG